MPLEKNVEAFLRYKLGYDPDMDYIKLETERIAGTKEAKRKAAKKKKDK